MSDSPTLRGTTSWELYMAMGRNGEKSRRHRLPRSLFQRIAASSCVPQAYIVSPPSTQTQILVHVHNIPSNPFSFAPADRRRRSDDSSIRASDSTGIRRIERAAVDAAICAHRPRSNTRTIVAFNFAASAVILTAEKKAHRRTSIVFERP
ncbi:hypothetical protein SCHPADRAFT_933474 [Schizopora paradoxa]|uniref:Uncharacterized protein n=1 Tax=Schizopora paradoxa TaxID=27342 RepID=A0A0H2R1S4_9AGAM|nr:hypothetical protein SCHPADRAFT_933474 [Schizopora paradoxa]